MEEHTIINIPQQLYEYMKQHGDQLNSLQNIQRIVPAIKYNYVSVSGKNKDPNYSKIIDKLNAFDINKAFRTFVMKMKCSFEPLDEYTLHIINIPIKNKPDFTIYLIQGVDCVNKEEVHSIYLSLFSFIENTIQVNYNNRLNSTYIDDAYMDLCVVNNAVQECRVHDIYGLHTNLVSLFESFIVKKCLFETAPPQYGKRYIDRQGNTKQFCIDNFCSYPDEIPLLAKGVVGKMYLGKECSRHPDILKELNIKLIITITAEYEPYPKINNTETLYYNVSDSEDTETCQQMIDEILPDIYIHVDSVIDSKQNVLVHCAEGISRSASVVIYYLMRKYKLKYTEAFNHVKKYRPIIQPNAGFVAYLCGYENMIGGGSPL